MDVVAEANKEMEIAQVSRAVKETEAVKDFEEGGVTKVAGLVKGVKGAKGVEVAGKVGETGEEGAVEVDAEIKMVVENITTESAKVATVIAKKLATKAPSFQGQTQAQVQTQARQKQQAQLQLAQTEQLTQLQQLQQAPQIQQTPQVKQIKEAQAKRDLRKTCRIARNELKKSYVKAASAKIAKQLYELQEWQSAQTIILYASFGNEVATWPIIKKALVNGRSVFLPRIKDHNGEADLELVPISKQTVYLSSKLGMLEPKGAAFDIRSSKFDLIVVPGLAFSQKGGRLGYGGGYYDKLLSKLNVSTKIGLCFKQFYLADIPLEQHDQLVDIIIKD